MLNFYFNVTIGVSHFYSHMMYTLKRYSNKREKKLIDRINF